MSKKLVLWICSISCAIVALGATLLCVLLPDKGNDSPEVQNPSIIEPDNGTNVDPIVGEGHLSIKQESSDLSHIIKVGYKGAYDETFKYAKTLEGNENMSSEKDDMLYCEEGLILDSISNPYIIFEFIITNNDIVNLSATLDFATEGAARYSTITAYSHDGKSFSHKDYGNKANSGVSIFAGETEKYYLKIYLNGNHTKSSFDGVFSWTLKKINPEHKVRIGNTSYATIEEARIAAQPNDIICIIEDISTDDVFYVEKPLYIYADRDLTWTTKSVSGISICEYNPGYYACNLWLGCDNGNKLKVLSTGGYNAIFQTTSSLYLAADLVCATQQPGPDCVGIRKVGYYNISPKLVIYGGTISGFYYGIVDVEESYSVHEYVWGSIYNCVEGVHVSLGFAPDPYNNGSSTISIGAADKTFYIYSCSNYAIYYDGKYQTQNLGHIGSYISKITKLTINNLILGEDEKHNQYTQISNIIGCGITLIDTCMDIKGNFKCNNFVQTPVYLTGGASISSEETASIELKNNKGSAGAAILADSRYNIKLYNAEITGNSSEANGGAIYLKQTHCLLYNSTISNNVSEGMGGAILSEAGNILLDNCIVSGNSAKSHGGAIFSQGEVIINNTKIFNNTSKGDGGAIYFSNITDEIINIEINNGTEFYNNTAAIRGGAIKVGEGVSIILNSVYIHDNKVNNTTAITYGGGVYLNSGSELYMSYGEISNNIASGLYSLGGNVFVSGEYYEEESQTTVPVARFCFEESLICGDGTTKQASAGGGIANAGECYLLAGEIKDCVADYASGIVNHGLLYVLETKISSINESSSIGKAIANLGELNIAGLTLEGADMDIAMFCIQYGILFNISYEYSTMNVLTPLVDEENNPKQYQITFATVIDSIYTVKESTDLPQYYIDNSLPIINYKTFDGEGFLADANNFVNDNYDFVLTEDTFGLKLVAK